MIQLIANLLRYGRRIVTVYAWAGTLVESLASRFN